MPGLVRKLLIIAAADGLILQPLAQRNQQVTGSVQIDYRTHTLNPILDDVAADRSESHARFEAHGILGFLNVFTYSYLIAIAQKKQVAQLWGKPVFVITDVALIPIQSQTEASSALRKAHDSVRLNGQADHGEQPSADLIEDADNDALASLEDTWLDDEVAKDTSKGIANAQEPGIAEGVIGRKGAYGRFAERWFSKSGWTSGQRRNLGLSLPDSASESGANQHRRKSSSLQASPALRPLRKSSSGDQAPLLEGFGTPSSEADANTRRITLSLLPKLLQTLKLLFLSRTFYFSYDVDISRRLALQPTASLDLPLYKQFDSQYFWNRNITLPLVHGGYDELVLPVMQGFIGQRLFAVEPIISENESLTKTTPQKAVDASDETPESVGLVHEKASQEGNDDFLLTLISRRSTKRAGFRYLRRGVDEDGNVANCVETEQILARSDWTGGLVHSFVQTRGSMPLFFTQTPYTFKPAPLLHESIEANKRAMKRHFSHLTNSYGALQVVSLIDKHGVEVSIGNKYAEFVKTVDHEMGAGHVEFNWFDFHNICRGMKFENVSILIEELGPFLKTAGWTKMQGASKLGDKQAGIVRTNCMDCLDRTNVVQSAIALHTLERQLAEMLSERGPSSNRPVANDPKSEAFNNLWADNGDAISLTYAGTAALKGDYVRTRKRTTLGLLSDLSLTLSRYYRNLFDDFFAQAALDYVLGTVSPTVFVEFQERMSTADPAIDLTRARQSAVTSAANIIISDHEDLLGGWAVGAPAATSLETALAPQPPTATASLPLAKAGPSALRAQPFRDTLFLLSDKAVYSVAYDWDAEKVRGFERIELNRITKLQWGTYITETNSTRQMDRNRNIGLRLEFNATQGRPQLRRMNTRTVGELIDPAKIGTDSAAPRSLQNNDGDGAAEDISVKEDTGQRVIAFKLLSQQTSAATSVAPQSEKEVAKQIGTEVLKAMQRDSPDTVSGKGTDDATTTKQPSKIELNEADIVSLEEARRSTTFAESIGYGLKRLVWG